MRPVALISAPASPPTESRSISSTPLRSLSAVSTVSAVRPATATGPTLTWKSRSLSAKRLAPLSETKSEAKAVNPSTSISPPSSRISTEGLESAGSVASTWPLNFALPSTSSRSEKVWRVSVRSTLALKPAAGRRRIASSTSLDSHAAKPDGWATASSSEPEKPNVSLTLRRPLASSRVRPGSMAASDFMPQPPGAGSAASLTSRMVVSPASTAGSVTSTEPGMVGRGRPRNARSNAATRWASVKAPSPVLPTASSNSTCAPVASIAKRGLAPRSTEALPSAV